MMSISGPLIAFILVHVTLVAAICSPEDPTCMESAQDFSDWSRILLGQFKDIYQSLNQIIFSRFNSCVIFS